MEVELTQNEIRDRDGSKDRRANKRAASKEREEGEWITVGSRKKPNCNSSDSLEHDELCEVMISCKEKLPKQIGLAKILKETGIQGIIKVTYKSPYKVVLRFSNYKNSREKNIREVMARNQCTYKMALKEIGGNAGYGPKANYQRQADLSTPEMTEITESVIENVQDTSYTPREGSYAEVVKTPSKTERRTVTTVRRLKKPDDKSQRSTNKNQFEWISSFNCGTQEGNKNDKKKGFELHVVISRLKEIICSDMEFEMKLTGVLKYIVGEVICWLKEYFTMDFVWKLLGGLTV
ncbi:hypothetical protein PYW07_013399 [Mythimna separata]|uniref:Uncharacterized protein n=1 Tax=Mythimna separata TaxID=271217 RepID=A0AAD7Y6P7_MYTSE|nr:hypothetical protein PYW07_013399 [Mythimna separata]